MTAARSSAAASNVHYADFGGSRARAAELYGKAVLLDDDTPEHAEECARLYHEAVRLDPQHHYALTNLGNLAFAEGEVEEAARLWRRALSICPTQPEALYNLGYLALKDRPPRAHEAIQLLTQVLAVRPNYTDAYYNLGEAYRLVKRPAVAIVAFRDFCKRSKDREWTRIARARIRLCQGEVAGG